MISSAILLSGNNFGKVKLFAKFLKMRFVGSSVYSRIQRCYIIPSIECFWDDHQRDVLVEFQGKEVVMLGN